MIDWKKQLESDRKYVWHPYSGMNSDLPVYPVQSAQGVYLHLSDGRKLIDGMSSWWSAIHGYNHPFINRALTNQLQQMAHVMFGGLTHQPAIELASQLVKLTPPGLEQVFFVDSGSVAVEVALKMAIQYWHAHQQPERKHFLTVRGGYHGDTFAAMSVSDPENGMHHLFSEALTPQFYAPKPDCKFGDHCSDEHTAEFERLLQQHRHQLAAVILEPIVQGAGGMNFYSAEYLKKIHQLCQQYHVLLILDEIATGFGRTGQLFASEHSQISPDILCLGKALTGGYLTLAATLTTRHIAETISNHPPRLFMHGPTFMGNPLACKAGLASIELLLKSPWKKHVQRIENGLREGLSDCQNQRHVRDVRVLGAIGVIELERPVNMRHLQPRFVEAGVWVRPFNRLIYLMPPFIINDDQLRFLTEKVAHIVRHIEDSLQ